MRGANEAGNFFNLPGSLSTPQPVIHDSHRVYIGYKKFTESRGRSHIVRPSASLAPLLPLPESPGPSSQPPRGHPTTVLHSFSLFSLSLSRNTPVGWARGISPLSVSVYGSNKTGTTHSFCVGYIGGACRGRGRRGALVVVIGHQVLYPCRRETETGGSEGTVKRY